MLPAVRAASRNRMVRWMLQARLCLGMQHHCVEPLRLLPPPLLDVAAVLCCAAAGPVALWGVLAASASQLSNACSTAAAARARASACQRWLSSAGPG